MYFVTVMFSAQSSTVPNSIASTMEARRTSSTVPSRLLKMPEPTFADVDALVGPATRAGARPRRGASGPPLRRGEDGAARPPRLRLVEGARRRPRAPLPAGVAGAAQLRARGRTAAAPAMSLDGSSVLVTGGTRGI